MRDLEIAFLKTYFALTHTGTPQGTPVCRGRLMIEGYVEPGLFPRCVSGMQREAPSTLSSLASPPFYSVCFGFILFYFIFRIWNTSFGKVILTLSSSTTTQ